MLFLVWCKARARADPNPQKGHICSCFQVVIELVALSFLSQRHMHERSVPCKQPVSVSFVCASLVLVKDKANRCGLKCIEFFSGIAAIATAFTNAGYHSMAVDIVRRLNASKGGKSDCWAFTCLVNCWSEDPNAMTSPVPLEFWLLFWPFGGSTLVDSAISGRAALHVVGSIQLPTAGHWRFRWAQIFNMCTSAIG